jgi:hypothetical protein
MQPKQKGNSLYILDVQRQRNSTKLVCVLINVVEKKGDSCMWHQNLSTKIIIPYISTSLMDEL